MWACTAGAVLSSACSVGVGGAFVGQWRARSVVDYDVCIEDDAGRCASRKLVEHQQRARTFSGGVVSFPSVGVASVSVDDAGARTTVLRLGSSFEYLRGRGRLALGARAGVVVDVDSDDSRGRPMLAVPISGIGHLGLSDRFALYAGFGLSPYARARLDDGEGRSRPMVSTAGWCALVGWSTVLFRTYDTRTIAIVEADTLQLHFGDRWYRSFAATLQLGVFL